MCDGMIPIRKHTILPSHRRSVHPNTAPLHVCNYCATRPLERKETLNGRVIISHARMEQCASFPVHRLTVTTLIGDKECQTKKRASWTVHEPTLTGDGARMSSQRLEGQKKITRSRGEQGGESRGRKAGGSRVLRLSCRCCSWSCCLPNSYVFFC